MSPAATQYFRRNRWTFGVGTLGRDMVYTLIASYLIFFLTEVVDLPDDRLWWVSSIMLGVRLFDAFTDIVMGRIVDNTSTRWGQYKPWISAGALASAVLTVLLFADLGDGWAYVALFCVVYLAWSLAWTMNDIPYWSLLPALSIDQKEREQAGSIAKAIASLGMFAVVIGVLPLTNWLSAAAGSQRAGWIWFATGVVVVMLICQSITLFWVREPKLMKVSEHTSVKGLWEALARNDQLLWISLALVLFQVGFITTTSFGVYYFKYVYRDESAYPTFALVLAVGQLTGFVCLPLLSRIFSRTGLYTLATGLIIFGYVLFFFAPANIVILSVAGLPMFFGNALIAILMLMFLSDTIEYGQWKLGKRNTAITFSLQPFINKVGAAVGTQVVAITAIQTGINSAADPAAVDPSGILGLKVMMIFAPLALIIIGYVIFRSKYRLDAATYSRIVADLKERGDLD